MNGSTHNECRTRDSLLRAGEEPPLASHLVTPRSLYSHHGIYVGSGRVIHYAGLAHGWRRGPVEEVSLESFAHGRDIRVRHERVHFERSAVVARARSRLGEHSYRVLTNNCEHFCAGHCATRVAARRSKTGTKVLSNTSNRFGACDLM